jgi:hypothetical protein
MRFLQNLRARWKARRFRLAAAQMEAGGSEAHAPVRASKGGAFSRMTKASSHTEWRGD